MLCFDKFPYLNNKKYFIFDMDWVIIDIEDINYKAYRYSIERILWVPIDIDYYNNYFKWKKWSDSLKDFFYNNKIRFDNKLMDQITQEIIKIKLELLEISDLSKNLIYDIKKFLDLLKWRWVKLWLATSTIRKFADIILRNTNLQDAFDVIVCAEDVKLWKPNPEIFKTTFNMLWGIDTQEWVVFEDSYPWVKAAIDGGFTCMWIWEPIRYIFTSDEFHYFWNNFECFNSLNNKDEIYTNS